MARLSEGYQRWLAHDPEASPLDQTPGEIVTVRPRRRWRYARSPSLSGDIVSTRLDVTALGLTPLRLQPTGTWDPAEEYWGEEGDELEAWARTIIARGPRPEFEMEQVLLGTDPDNPDTLDAHVHLGNLAFDRHPAEALRHYEAGVRIGEPAVPATLASSSSPGPPRGRGAGRWDPCRPLPSRRSRRRRTASRR